jgi:hypothetical protein
VGISSDRRKSDGGGFMVVVQGEREMTYSGVNGM